MVLPESTGPVNIWILAITTTRRSDISYPHMGGMQVLDQQAYFKPAVKWNTRVDQWKRIPDAVRHAFRSAVTGRPGPVHIEFPEDLLSRPWENEAGMTWDRVDKVLMVGGSTHMPMTARMLRELSGQEPDRSLAVSEVVARGVPPGLGSLTRGRCRWT